MRRAIGLLVVGLALSACSTNSANDAAASATPEASKTPTPAGSPLLAEGRSFGYVHSLNTAKRTIVFDLAEFLTGPAADKAAQDDGVIGPGEHVDNDYYIRNQSKKLRTVPYSTNVRIRIVDWANCCNLKDGAIAPFAASFTGGTNETYHGPDSAYWLTVSAGTVTEIEEQYVP